MLCMIRPFQLGALLAALIAYSGCTTVSQEQYFEVVGKPDIDTGQVPKAYYKMTVSGSSHMIGKYKMSVGYVSAETIDALQGNIPTIPTADLDEVNNKSIDTMKKTLLEKLESYAKAQGTLSGSSAGEHEAQVVAIARQIWVASLNDPDLFSMGRMETTDPARFRKLVFYANSKQIDLDVEHYGSQIDSIIDKTSVLSSAMRERKKAAEAAATARKSRQGDFVRDLLKAPDNTARTNAIIDYFWGIATDSEED